MATGEDFEISKSTPFDFRLELEALSYELASCEELADFCKAITSVKEESSSLKIHPSLSTAGLKQKIRDDLGFQPHLTATPGPSWS